jgi:hypothetical protein
VNTILRTASVALVILSGTAIAGCNRGGADDGGDEDVDSATAALAADGTDASAAASQATDIDSQVFAAIDVTDPTAAAIEATSSPVTSPPACVTRSQLSATEIEFTFNGCTGPFGLVALTGSETATFSEGAGGALHIELASDGLMANGLPIVHAASADVTFDGALRHVDWHGGWTHTTVAGRAVAQTNDFTLAIDTASSCVTIDGTSDTTVDARGVNLSFSSLKLCGFATGACPSGSVAITGENRPGVLTLSYDGSGDVAVTAGALDFSVHVACGE